MNEYKIAAIPGDGIGKEVVAAGVQVLEALAKRDGGFKLQVQEFPWGSDYYKQHGRMMAADGLDTLKGFDAIYFGAVGAPDLPDDITLVGTAARDLPGLRSVRQRAPYPRAARHRASAEAQAARPTSTGSSSARTARASTPGTAGARIAAIRRKSAPRPRSSRAPA